MNYLSLEEIDRLHVGREEGGFCFLSYFLSLKAKPLWILQTANFTRCSDKQQPTPSVEWIWAGREPKWGTGVPILAWGLMLKFCCERFSGRQEKEKGRVRNGETFGWGRSSAGQIMSPIRLGEEAARLLSMPCFVSGCGRSRGDPVVSFSVPHARRVVDTRHYPSF